MRIKGSTGHPKMLEMATRIPKYVARTMIALFHAGFCPSNIRTAHFENDTKEAQLHRKQS